MGQGFTLEVGRGKLAHINQRKQGDEDSKDLRVDLKFLVEAPAGVLDKLLPDGDGSIAEALWNSEGAPKDFALSLGEISVTGTWSNHKLVLHRGSRRAKPREYHVDVKKLAFRVLDKRKIDLSFSAIGISPLPGDLDIFGAVLQEHVDIEIIAPPATEPLL